MKKYLLLLILPVLMVACKPKTKTNLSPPPTASTDYPYKIKNPDYWLMDTSHANTMVALRCLKSFETNDTVTMKGSLADTIEFNYDGGTFKGNFTQFGQAIAAETASMKNIKLDVKDWESVVSKDAKESWVTVWYIQKWDDGKGKADSVSLINDIQLKGGKIIKINEYARHFRPVK
jgi:uncharacterized protein YcfL